MSARRRVAIRVDAENVPPGLVAMHVEQARVGPDGRAKVRGPGPDGPRRLVLAPEEGVGALHDAVSHGVARAALAGETRRRSVRDELTDDEIALVLARAGLVRLLAAATTTDGVTTADEWRSWERTPAGDAWAATYAGVDHGDPVVAHAVTLADRLDEGDADAWAAAVAREVERVGAVCDRAAALVDDGEVHGWSAARFAEEVTGDPAGLDEGAPLAPLVLGHLARRLGAAEEPTTPAARAALLAAAGIGASSLAGTVASVRLPGGGGAAGALLGAAAAHAVPLLLQREVVAVDGGRPVAPPRSVSWVFAVQHEDTFEAAAALPGRTPVVLHGGSPAALPLLEHAARSGWRIAVSASDDDAGRQRRSWLLDRLGDDAVAWGAREDGSARCEVADRDRLLDEITHGTPR